jgi:hypothetical protein
MSYPLGVINYRGRDIAAAQQGQWQEHNAKSTLMKLAHTNIMHSGSMPEHENTICQIAASGGYNAQLEVTF